MNAEAWDNCIVPIEMITYLEDSGCYLEFKAFFMNCFDRIRHEFHSVKIADTIYALNIDVDELTDAASEEIETMTAKLSSLDEKTEEWKALNREIIYSRAVLARDYHDFGEANRFLSSYLIEIADDPDSESRIQVEFLRTNYSFPFIPPEDE